MKTDTHTLDGMNSPWGRIDCSEEIADGIWQVMTPSHGGIWLSPSRRQQMPDNLKNWSSPYSNTSDGWYEEDCDWAVACIAFPEEFGDRSHQIALDLVRHHRKDYFPVI